METRENGLFRLEQDAPGAPVRMRCAACGELLFDPERDKGLTDLTVDLSVQAHLVLDHGVKLSGGK